MEIFLTEISDSIDDGVELRPRALGQNDSRISRFCSEGLAGNYPAEGRGGAHSLQYPATRVIIDVT